MNKNKKITSTFIIIGVLLLIFQALLIGVAAPREYWLVHEWVFYAINYTIILSLFFIGSFASSNKYMKMFLLLAGVVLLTANTTFFYYMGDVNVVISESRDGQHEVILKEYKKMDYETVRIERRGYIFGKRDAVLAGSSEYKALEEETYKIEWPADDIAALTYQTSAQETLDQQIFNFRSSDYVSYQNVVVGLLGKWLEQDYPENYFMSDNSEFVYAKDGELYYYRIENTRQYGIFSLIIEGDETNPALTVVLNPDSEFNDSGLIADGGSITITPVSLGEAESRTYYKE